MTPPTPTAALACACALLLAAAPLRAQPGPPEPAPPERAPPGAEQPAAPETSDDPGEVSTTPSIAESFPNPDPGGVRTYLGERGITYGLAYIGETLGNVSGGIRRGVAYQGRLDMQLDVDFEKLAGVPGLSAHANAYQIHGRGLSGCCLGNVLVVSGIEARATTRLYEAWVEQKLWGDRVALRAGQLGADTEFFVSQYAGLFVNATFGWPSLTATDLPAGGPAYPLSALGARLKLVPMDGLTVLAAVFNGDPAGPGSDPQGSNGSGTSFRTSDPPLVMAEVAYAYNQGRGAAGLPGVVKLGGYHHFGRFDDLRYGPNGLSLNDPNAAGVARRLSGESGVYAVLDQLVWREPGTRDQGLGLFLRVSASPSEASALSFYADGGVTYKGLIPGRVNDTLGLGVAYARFSGAARGSDRDAARFGAGSGLVRSSEAVVELTYQAEIVPGFTVQPDVQYVIRPGGRIANPRDPNGGAVKNAAVLGLRATVRY